MPERSEDPEIESLNLADLNMSGLESRLELAALAPQLYVCGMLCATDCTCHNFDGCTVLCDGNTGCACDSLA
jgi:hypothetical protein